MSAESAIDMETARALLQLEQVAERRFRSQYNQENYGGTLFGGQALGQALAAAHRTAPGWPVHSCTGYYHRGGAVDQPVDYDVEVVRDGRRFAARRVLASQGGYPIFDLLCSFHDPEEGFRHQVGDVTGVPSPDGLLDIKDFVTLHGDRLPKHIQERHARNFPIEVRLLDPENYFFGALRDSQHSYWFRMPSAAAVEGMRDHQCLLAFMSDYWLASTVGAVRRSQSIITGRVFVATLNHSLWFHAPVRADEWLLFRTESPWSGEGRGLVRGLIYDRSGQLIANAVQEVSMRPHKGNPVPA
ncbi:MAG: acyl-CoA thioesterase II [Rhodospirillaceae bacterium]|nr:MAG: acyl-CoA thioesterase II [Rhodospirillaceae bacterium]